MQGRLIATGISAALALAAVTFVKSWEGESLTPYRDIVGVATVCYGATDVEMRRYTREECEAQLTSSIGQFYVSMNACLPSFVNLTQNQQVALLSWSYNVGVGAACKSTLVRKVKTGAAASDWCKELLRWDYAGGKKVRGLTNRRNAEYELCISV